MVENVTTPAAVGIDRVPTKAGLKLFSAQYSIPNFNDASVTIDGTQLRDALLAAGAKVGKVTELEINYYGALAGGTVKMAYKDGDGISHYIGGVVCTSATNWYVPDAFPVSLPMLLRAGADDWASMIALVNAGYGATDAMIVTIRGEIYL